MSAVILRFLDERDSRRLVIPEARESILTASFTSPLQVPIEEMRYCSKCDSVQLFVADRDCEFGLVGVCHGCGDEFLRPFSRTTTEVAS